jgi:hypothetical protein
VARVHDGLVRQRTETLERTLELRAVGKRKISSPNRSGKETITNESDSVSVYRDVSGRMARNMDHRELQRSDVEHVSVSKLAIGRWGLLDPKAKNHRVLSGTVVNRTLARVKIDGDRRLANDARDSANVVHVGMCQPNRIELGPVFSDSREKTLRFLTGIDQDSPPGRVINDEVRVLLQRSNGERPDDHTAYPPLEVSSGSS